MAFDVVILKRAVNDVQQSIDYYDDEQQSGLGKRFGKTIDGHFDSLKKNPFYQIRHSNVRCLPIKNYPFMIHFTVHEKDKTIFIQAVLHTSLNPNKWP